MTFGRKPVGVDLSRTEIAHVADALDALVDFHGSRSKASDILGIALHTFSRFGKRSAYERATPESLEPVARAFELTVEQLLAGKGPSGKRRRG